MGDFDKITVGGKSVEQFLAEKNPVETIKSDKHHLKRKIHMDYKQPKEKHGEVHYATQMALNKTNLESNLKRSKLRVNAAVAMLITGDPLTTRDIVKNDICSRQTDASALLRVIMKSRLGDFVKVTKGYKGLRTYVYAGNHDYGRAVADVNTRSIPPLLPDPPKVPNDPVITNDTIVKDVVINLTVKIKLEVI